MPKNIGKISLEEIAQVFEILNEGKTNNLLSPGLIARFIDSSDYGILEAKKIKGTYFILSPDGENKTFIDTNNGKRLVFDESGIYYFENEKSKKEMPLNYEKAQEYLISEGYEFNQAHHS